MCCAPKRAVPPSVLLTNQSFESPAVASAQLLPSDCAMDLSAQEALFLQSIEATPDDDGVRLVYADWLSSQADEAFQARGEFIRVQIALSQMGDLDRRLEPLHRRQTQLIVAHALKWLPKGFPWPEAVTWVRGMPEVEFNQQVSWSHVCFWLGKMSPLSLTVHVSGDLSEDPLRALRELRSMPRLRLKGNILNGRERLAHLSKVPGLRSLELIVDRVDGLATLANIPELDSLTVTTQHPLDPVEAGSLARCPRLRVLSLRKTGVVDLTLALLAESSTLESLDLHRTPITDEGLRHLAWMPNLLRLNLSCCQRVSDQGLAYLAERRNWAKLTIKNCPQLTDEGLDLLLENLAPGTVMA